MRLLRITFLFLLVLTSFDTCLGQNEKPAVSDQEKKKENRRQESAERRDRMRKFSAAVRFFEVGDKSDRGQVVAQPILRFDDNARENDDGTVWVWGRAGRPLAVSEIFSNTGQKSLSHTGHSLTTRPLAGDLNGVRVVTARKAGISLQGLDDGPRPAQTAVGRLRQFKQLARRFTAHEFWLPGNTRYELRPLAQPLYRYSDPDRGIVDGALLAFCHGTNPEVIMLLELVDRDDAEATWQFAFARLAHADCHVHLDGKEVWSCVRYLDVVPAGEAYWTFARTFAQVDNPQPAPQPQPQKSRLRSLLDSLFEPRN